MTVCLVSQFIKSDGVQRPPGLLHPRQLRERIAVTIQRGNSTMLLAWARKCCLGSSQAAGVAGKVAGDGGAGAGGGAGAAAGAHGS